MSAAHTSTTAVSGRDRDVPVGSDGQRDRESRVPDTRPVPDYEGTVSEHDLDVPAPPLRASSVLAIAENAFQLLVTGPSPLALDGAQLPGCGLPARLIDLGELRSILLHPGTPVSAGDVVWRDLIARARAGEAWMVGAVGVAWPGLTRLVARLQRRLPDTADIDAEVLTGFIAAIRTIPLTWDHLALNLCRIARKTAMRAYHTQTGPVPIAPEIAESLAPRVPWGHPDLLLADAVRLGIITKLDAFLVGETRLGDDDLTDLATQLGMTYWAAAKRRRRAEYRLAGAIKDGRLCTRIPG